MFFRNIHKNNLHHNTNSKHMLQIEIFNTNTIIYNDNYDNLVKYYYDYVLFLIKENCLNNSISNINIILGNYYFYFNNCKITIRIDFNFEHTLVLKDGRDNRNAPFGNIRVNEHEYYLVRIQDYETLNRFDIVIDYSKPNIINVGSSNTFQSFYDKMVYISPLIYELYSIKNNRTVELLTTFFDTNQPRRHILLTNINEHKLNHININNCFDKNELQNLYKNTKILINIHQTDHHHTLEELRVLPALLCGVVVICEESPLKEAVEYSDFLVWTTYENIMDTIQEVQSNYDEYYNKFFGNQKLENVINKMKENNSNSISRKIDEYTNNV